MMDILDVPLAEWDHLDGVVIVPDEASTNSKKILTVNYIAQAYIGDTLPLL